MPIHGVFVGHENERENVLFLISLYTHPKKNILLQQRNEMGFLFIYLQVYSSVVNQIKKAKEKMKRVIK